MTIKTAKLKIDHEFRSLIPELTAEERNGLESAVLRDGCRDPLVAWRGTLIDGHNRHEICEKHGIKYQIKELEFPDREAVKLWIEENQLGRRNLTDDQRSAIAYRVMQRRSEIEKKKRAQAGRAAGGDRKADEPKRLSDTVTEKRSKPKSDTRAAVAKEAKIPERKVRAVAEIAKAKPALVEKIAAGTVTVKEAAREVRQEKKAEQRREAAKEAEKIVADDDMGVKHGDFRDVAKSIADDSVSLIFTDPPYDKKTLPLYGDMAREAARILKPGGSMICYLGQFQIGDVCNLVTPHLRLWWTLACIHTGTSARMTEYGIVVKWKPMLWFVKGTRGDKQTFVDDAIFSEKEKSHHEWQQGVKEASYYIDKLTLPGDLVFDPFCGGATTAVAAKQLKRRWLTCDMDVDSAKIGRKRLHDAKYS